MHLTKLLRLASLLLGVYALLLAGLFFLELLDGRFSAMEVFYVVNFLALGLYFLGFGLTGEKRISRMLSRLRGGRTAKH
jgi:hypothetical protein